MASPSDPTDESLAVADAPSPEPRGSTLRAYLELFRLPNVFTAMADVMLGFFFTHPPNREFDLPWLPPWGLLAALLGASTLLYIAGMVLNDFFDAKTDARERPGRPIPSGRVPRATAGWLGFQMLLLGAALGWWASYGCDNVRPGLLASALAGAVLLYDGVLKKTPLGPVGMGACRFLNVLLGMSVAGAAFGPAHYLVAGGIGVYIVGVTLFARTEARASTPAQLAAGTMIMAIGIGLVGWFPNWAADSNVAISQNIKIANWRLLLCLVAALIVYRCISAIIDHGVPRKVQLAVVNCIRSLIVLDAFACIAVAGVGPALAIVLLIVPMLILGRWLYST